MSEINWTIPSAAGIPNTIRHFTYGNYGGAGWTGGQYYGDAFNGPAPVNDLDALYQQHDQTFSHTDAGQAYISNKALVEGIDAMMADPNSDYNNGTMGWADRQYSDFSRALFEDQLQEYEEQNNVPPEQRYTPPPGAVDPSYSQPTSDFLPDLNPMSPYIGNWQFANNPAAPPSPPPPTPSDPLVLDLDGDGVELISIDDSTTFFDFDLDGVRELGGWVAPDDGLLALDANGNGRIDDLAELFGGENVNGFEELATLDENSDNVIDANDSAFANLVVWQDLDSDGETDANELKTLAQIGITSISTNYSAVSQNIAGNLVDGIGSYGLSSGQNLAINSVWFEVSQFISEYSLPANFSYSDVSLKLPNLRGYGDLPDLAVSLTLNPDLVDTYKSLLLGIVSAELSDTQLAMSDFMYEWAGVSNVDPGIRGSFVDARKVSFLAEYYGVDIWQNSQVLNSRQATVVNETFDKIIDNSIAKILPQIGELYYTNMFNGDVIDFSGVVSSAFFPVSMAFSGFTYDFDNEELGGDFGVLLSLLNDALADDAAVAYAQLSQFSQYLYLYSDVLGGKNGNSFADSLVDVIYAYGEFLNFTPEFFSAALVYQKDFIEGTIGGDSLNASAESYVFADAGDDTVNGSSGADTLVGSLGNDALHGGWGSDTYVFTRGDGQDAIEDNGHYDTDRLVIRGYTPAEVEVQRATGGSGVNDLLLTFTGTTDSITVWNTLEEDAPDQIEQIVFDDGTIWTMADLRLRIIAESQTSGDDVVQGFKFGETLEGGLGNDTLHGGQGSDTYVFTRGDGQDAIEDNGHYSTDRLLIHGYTPAEVEVQRATGGSGGNDLLLTFTGTPDSITVWNTLEEDAPDQIEQIVFDDGTIWTMADLRLRIIAESQTSGDDVVQGFKFGDTLEGGLGNDTLHGGWGSDTYVFNRGDGQDTIEDNGHYSTDRLLIHGYTPAEVQVRYATGGSGNNDVLLQFVGTSDSIIIWNTLDGSAPDQIEEIVFDDGTIWTMTDLQTMLSQGTDGDDLIIGGSGPDTFNGGLGDDTLIGGAGSDIYYYASGDGNDVIDEEDGSTTAVDELRFTDLNAADILLSRSGVHLLATILATGEVITMDEQFWDHRHFGIDKIVFADGTSWDRARIASEAQIFGGAHHGETLYGTSGDDVFDGGLGNDHLLGGAGSDVYHFTSGDGSDVIDEEDGSTSAVDELRLSDLNASDIKLSASGVHLYATVIATGEVITIDEHFWDHRYFGIEKIVFADGTFWDRDRIEIEAHTVYGDAGANTIHGTSWRDTFYGGLGDDTLLGGNGSDIYHYASGDGNDVIDEEDGSTSAVDELRLSDLNASDIKLSASGVHLYATVIATGEVITIDEHFWDHRYFGIEKIVFADGTFWDRDRIEIEAHTVYGDAGANTIHGTSWRDTFYGGLGDDTLLGGNGSDIYHYASGDGNDVIDEEDGSTSAVDELRFSDLNANDIVLSRSGVHLYATVVSTGEVITIDEHFWDHRHFGIDKIVFADGTSWDRTQIGEEAHTLRGTNLADTITGTGFDETLIGQQGDDALTGGGGSDAFVFRTGDGHDTVQDFGTASGDVIEFDQIAGLTSFADVLAKAADDGQDTTITIDANNSVELTGVLVSELQQDDFRFV